MTKNIIAFTCFLDVSGATILLKDIIKGLTKNNYNVYLILTEGHANPLYEDFSREGINIINLAQKMHRFHYASFLLPFIEEHDIGIILLMHSYYGYWLLPAIKRVYPDLPVIEYFHLFDDNFLSGGYPRLSSRFFSRYFAKRVCISRDLINRCVREFGQREEDFVLIYPGIDTKRLESIARPEKEEGERGTITFIGRLEDQKRPQLFVEIAEELLKEEESKPFFLIIGDGKWSGLIEDFKNSHPNDIEWIKYTDNIGYYLDRSDILLLPSSYEGLPIVILEAMARGVVPVSASVGAVAELVTPDVGYAINVQEGEENKYIEVLKYLNSYPDIRKEIGKRARDKVLTYFTLDKMNAEFLNLINEYYLKNSLTRSRFGSVIADILYRMGYIKRAMLRRLGIEKELF